MVSIRTPCLFSEPCCAIYSSGRLRSYAEDVSLTDLPGALADRPALGAPKLLVRMDGEASTCLNVNEEE